MIQHLVKLAWNRRRTTGLLLAEILVCFFVLSAVFVFAVRYASRWGEPLGFEYADVWWVKLGIPESGPRSPAERVTLEASIHEVLTNVEQIPGVASVAAMSNTPYSSSTDQNTIYIGGHAVTYLWSRSSLDAAEVLGLEIVAGRWFSEADGALAETPVVLDREFARALFPGREPIGQTMVPFDDNGNVRSRESGEEEIRVIGLIDTYRRDGELSAASPVAFVYHGFQKPSAYPPGELVIRAQPGTGASLEEKLVRSIRAMQPDWSVESRSLTEARAARLRIQMAPLLAGIVIAGFLVGTAGLGLVGVLWQSVAARTQEIGLRRAMGASRTDVRVQIAGELGALAFAALLLGSLLLLQIPFLFPALGVTAAELAAGLGLGAIVILVFVGLCAWYPAQLAARIEPARALQYE